MIKRVFAFAAAAAAVVGLGLAPVAASASTGHAPAAKRTSGMICTHSGNHYCIGSDDLNLGTAIEAKSTGGRNITFNGGAGGVAVISLNGASNRCIATVSNELTLRIEVCNATGTNWFFESNTDGTRYWINSHTGLYMACDNHANDVCVARSLGANGWYYKMNPIS